MSLVYDNYVHVQNTDDTVVADEMQRVALEHDYKFHNNISSKR